MHNTINTNVMSLTVHCSFVSLSLSSLEAILEGGVGLEWQLHPTVTSMCLVDAIWGVDINTHMCTHHKVYYLDIVVSTSLVARVVWMTCGCSLETSHRPLRWAVTTSGSATLTCMDYSCSLPLVFSFPGALSSHRCLDARNQKFGSSFTSHFRYKNDNHVCVTNACVHACIVYSKCV